MSSPSALPTSPLGDKEYDFLAGDVLFVAAGVEHRFSNFSEGFATWVFFYGPTGGENQ